MFGWIRDHKRLKKLTDDQLAREIEANNLAWDTILENPSTVLFRIGAKDLERTHRKLIHEKFRREFKLPW